GVRRSHARRRRPRSGSRQQNATVATGSRILMLRLPSILTRRAPVRHLAIAACCSLGLAFTNVVGAAQVSLRWADNSSDESGFKVERANGSGAFAQIATTGRNVTRFDDTKVAAGTTYRYRVRAYNGAGNSPYSNIVTVKT